MAPNKLNNYFSFILSGTLILLLTSLYFLHPGFQEFISESWQMLWSEDQDTVQEYFRKFGLWGPLAIICFIVLQMFLLVFPTWIPIIVAVLAYGFWVGIAINIIGVGLASALGYHLGDKLEDTLFNNFMSKKKFERMKYWISNYGFGTVVLFRISPLLSTDSISFIAGILGMDFKKYMLATFTGIIPLSIAVAYFAQEAERLENGLYWVGGVGTLLYAFYIYLDHTKRKKALKEKS